MNSSIAYFSIINFSTKYVHTELSVYMEIYK